MREHASDSIAGKVAAARAVEASYDVPEGLPSLSELEQTAWNQYIAHKTDWKPGELRQLHTLVRMETKLAEIEAEAAVAEFTMQPTENSMIREHPIHAMVVKQQAAIVTQLRAIGLTSPYQHGGKPQSPAQPSNRGKRGKVSLLR